MKHEIRKIHERNQRVEADKAWETSGTRRIIIAMLTYFVIVIFLWSINVQKPFTNAIVPTVGFILSTLTLPLCKRWWMKKIYRK